MTGRPAFAVVIALLIATPVEAQFHHLKPRPLADSAVAGTWNGTYASDHASPGEMRLVVQRDSGWKAAVVIETPHGTSTSAAQSFKIDGKRVSWSQDLMGMSCDADAALDSGALKGRLVCGQAAIEFELKKRA